MGPSGAADEAATIRRAAELLAAHPFRCWFFGDSIGFEAIVEAARLFDEPSWLQFARGYVRAWAARATPYVESDNQAPGHAMCQIYERTGDVAVLDAAVRLAEHLAVRPRVNDILITFENAPLTHPIGPGQLPADEVALLASPGRGVFVDSMHFDPPFFAHLGRLTGDDTLHRLGIEQALKFINLLQDDVSGLFFHFYLEKTGKRYVHAWSRGQGWAILGLLDVAEQMHDEDEGRDEVVSAIRTLAGGMVRCQRDDGHWWAVADDDSSGDEYSTGAFMAAAFTRGMTAGILDSSFGEPARRAWEAALVGTSSDGKLQKVSAAVGACTDVTHYRHVPTGWLVPWGQGPLVLAAAARAAATAGSEHQ